MSKRVVVLLSGNGSNLQAIMDQQPEYNYQIVGVISNRPDAFGLERARQKKVPAIALDHKVFSSRASFDQQLITEIDRFQPDLLVLAGYMRLLSDEFVAHFQNKLINIHPSLLPNYKGLHTYQRVLADKQFHHGTTVHFVTTDLDSGASLIQASLAITSADTEESLRQRVQAMEHRVYPLAIHLFTSGRLTTRDSKVYLDSKLLNPQGYQLKEHALEIP